MNIFLKSLIIGSVIVGTAIMNAPTTHATSTATCIDGSKSSNIKVTWKSNSNVTIASVGNKPLCADTTLFFSSYTMPDNYNGKGFGDPSSTPQTVFNSSSVVLKKGIVPATSLSISLPEACRNKQVDVYYAPEVKTVNKQGHAGQFITGYIITKSLSECKPVTPPVTPTTPETPVVPTPVPTPVSVTPVVTPVVQMIPTELPKTGSNSDTATIVMTLLSVTTYAGVYALIAKRA